MIPIKIPKNRRDEIKQLVLQALQYSNSCHIPVKIKAIVRSFPNIRLVSYSKHMKKFGLSYKQMISFVQSSDACTDYLATKDAYIIYYNDIDKNIVKSNRYRWNIAHELGHILLHHHFINKTRIFRSTLTNYEYNLLEAEADFFAQLILVPHVLLYIYKVNNRNAIKNLCQISGPAAYNRYIDYTKWKTQIDENDFFDNAIFKFYYPFIYKRACNNCGAILVQKEKYCPICGKKSLQWGDGMMKYQIKIKVNTDSKALRCPVCDNEDISLEGNFCHICGTVLVNRCTDYNPYEDGYGCGALAAGNARYCIYCGAETTFFKQGFLAPWKKELQEFMENESFDNIIQDWGKIVQDMGGSIRPCLRDTVIEAREGNHLCIIFFDPTNYSLGSRPSVLSELEKYIKNHYGKTIYLKTHLMGSNNYATNIATIYDNSSPNLVNFEKTD